MALTPADTELVGFRLVRSDYGSPFSSGRNGRGKVIYTPLGVEASDSEGIYLLEKPGNLRASLGSAPLRLLRVEYDHADLIDRRHGIYGWEIRVRRCTPIEEIAWPEPHAPSSMGLGSP